MAAGRCDPDRGPSSSLDLALEDAAEAIGGELIGAPVMPGDIRLTGVSIDTRTIESGELFVAIEGPRFDGHKFVADAFDRGASAAVIMAGRLRIEAPGPLIEVENTVRALQQLAAYYRGTLRATVIGVTGSNGKTTTKDLVAHVLAGTRLVGGTRGNLNNHLGVPLTILSLRPEHQAAVIEMGASSRGEISTLARLAKPQIGVITNVGPTHLEQMGSVDQVARSKAELVGELNPGGTLAVNGDDERLMAEVRKVGREDLRIVTCGFGQGCKVKATSCRSVGPEGMEFEVEGWGAAKVPMLGRHNVTNALLALAVGSEMDMTFGAMRDRLASFKPPSMRMSSVQTGGLLVLNDCYNSNPASASAALQTLESLPAKGRRVAVLGDMLELGEGSAQFHRELGRKASFVDWLLTVGEWAEEVVAGAVEAGLEAERSAAYSDKAPVIEALLTGLRSGDVVLIKGSRALGMEELADAVKNEFVQGG